MKPNLPRCALRLIFITFNILLFACIAAAQESRGKILGRIFDSSGATIPGASITGINEEMNTRVPAVSNAAGNYELPFLLPGTYRIEVVAKGFKQHVRRPIEVQVGSVITVDAALEVGQISEKVDVNAEAPLLESATASMSSTIDHRQLADLPMGGGDVMFLTQLAAGITSAQAPGHNWLPSATDVMSNVSVNGVGNGNTDFSLDGIANMTKARVSFAPPGDMVQEFRVETVNYDASSGHSAGGSVNMSLKAGTNALHGTAEWLVAPNPWQANDFFTNKQLFDLSTGPVTPEKIARLVAPRKVNRYSATLGGPVYIPKLYDGINRTFWTYAFQGFNRRNPNTAYYTLPTAAQRNGDFSDLLQIPKTGSQYQIYDPATIANAPNGRTSRQMFPGNIVPKSRFDVTAQKYMQYFPLPNAPGTIDGLNNWNEISANNNDFTQDMSRVDHNFSNRHRVFGRFTYSWLHFNRGNFLGNGIRGLDRYRKQRGAGFDDVYTISPTMIFNFKYGFTRFIESDYPTSRGFDLASIGFPSSLISQIDPQAVRFPAITIDSVIQLGETTNSQYITNYHNFSASISKMQGNHSIRWGGEYRLMAENNSGYGRGTPTMAFSTGWTRGPLDNSAGSPGGIGQGFASFLLGLPTGGGIDKNANYADVSSFTGLFIQDDWKATRKLTFNLGMRWEYDAAPVERYNRSVRGFDYSVASPIAARALAAYSAAPDAALPVSQFRTMGVQTFSGINGQPRGFWNTGKKNFAPRVGMAYQLSTRMVLRAGYGIFYASNGVDQNSAIQNGFSQSTNLIPSDNNGLSFRANLANPFPDGVQLPTAVGPNTFLGRGISFSNDYIPNSYAQRWSFGIQRQFAMRSLLEVSYVGNRSTRILINRELDFTPGRFLSTSTERDQPVIDYLSAQVRNPFFGFPEFAGSGITGTTLSRGNLLRPYPQYNGMTGTDPSGFTWYHSMQSRFEKRFSHGLLFNVNHTWSKFMQATEMLNASDPGPTHVISNADRQHRLTITSLYELPVGKNRAFGSSMPAILDAALGGWQMQAIFLGQSGPPINFGNVLWRGTGPDDLGKLVMPVSDRTPDLWFNALKSSGPGVVGFETVTAKGLASNIRTFPLRLAGLRGDGQNYWNAALYKQFVIREKLRVQLRTEWEGALNHPNFSPPNATPTNTLFGQVTAMQGEARRIWIGLKLMF
jgi:hypothetical protein